MRLMERRRQLGGSVGRLLESDCLSIPVCVPPGGTNVSFEQFVDSPLSSWPTPVQTGSVFWTLGMPCVSCGHQCVIQMPWLHSHHVLLCSQISGLVLCTCTYLQWKHCSHLDFISRLKCSFFVFTFDYIEFFQNLQN